MQSFLDFNWICIYVATSFAFCVLSCELLSVRFFYYTVHCIVRPSIYVSSILFARTVHVWASCVSLRCKTLKKIYSLVFKSKSYTQIADFTVCHKSYLLQSKRINVASRWCGTIIRLNVGVYFLTLPFL